MRITQAFLIVFLLLTCGAIQAQYCIPLATGTSCAAGDQFIQNIKLFDASGLQLLNNSSVCGAAPAYENYAATLASVPLVPGLAYTISVIVGSYRASDPVHIWVDLNQNQSFEDAAELLLTMSSNAGSNGNAATLTGTFTLPPTAIPGGTRLRARLHDLGIPSPVSCTNSLYGNCEDYAVNVVSLPAPTFQTNQPGCALDFDGVLGTPTLAANSNRCAGANVVATSTVTAGLLHNIGLELAAPSSLGVVLPDGQIFNLNWSSTAWLFGGSLGGFTVSPGTWQIAFGAFVGTLSAQSVALDPSAPLGVLLSQPCSVTGHANSLLALPNADDAAYTVTLSAAPLCAPPVSWYGSSYTQITVSTNGLVSPGSAGVTGWYPNTASAMTNPGSFGIWADLHPGVGAAITVNGNGFNNGVDVSFTDVPYWGTTVTSTFNVSMDPIIGSRIEGISGLGTHLSATAMILHSQGGGLATDPGPSAFVFGGVFATLQASDMIYAIGPASPALATGIDRLWFQWSPMSMTFICI